MTFLHRDECEQREDRLHCICWDDGKACCYCNAAAMTDDEKREQGMDTNTSLREGGAS